MNTATIVTLCIVSAIIIAIIIKLIKDKKSGKNICCSGCNGDCTNCHKK